MTDAFVTTPTVVWYVCDLVTGRVLDEFPLAGVDTIRRRITQVTTNTFALPVTDPNCPPSWSETLAAGRTMIVLTLDGEPVQAWVVTELAIGDTTVPIQAATLEECLSRTNVPDYDPAGIDYSAAAAALCAELPARFGFVIETTPTGKTFTGSQTYSTDEDRSVLTALNEDINGAVGGPEWRARVRWTDDTRRAFTKVIEIRPRVGVDRPDAVYDLDTVGNGTIEAYVRTTSYAAGKGATLLIGTSEGSGASRPITDPQLSPLVGLGWPVWEERKNYTGLDADDIADEDAELLNRTRATLQAHGQGTVTWAVTGRATGPMPGRDFDEGDTVHIDVAARPPIDPIGGTAAVRTLGWELNLNSMQATPILWDDGEGGADG